MNVRIKICGLTREEDIAAVNEFLPDYIGFVFAERSRRYIGAARAAELKRRLDGRICAVGVFVDAEEEFIYRLAAEGVIDAVQLHGRESADYAERVRRATGLPVVKAVSMTAPDAGKTLLHWENSAVDFLLLDSGGGGTGKPFDHAGIGKIGKPFFLAGGLTPGSVAAAAKRVHPFAVDVSSGVETDGKKDREKIAEAIRRLRNE